MLRLFFAALVALGFGPPASAQTLEIVSSTRNITTAIDRNVTFLRDDGLTQSLLVEVPRQRAGRTEYSISLVIFDCRAGERRVLGRTTFSTERDPLSVDYRPPRIQSRDSDRSVGAQLDIACRAAADGELFTVSDLLAHRR